MSGYVGGECKGGCTHLKRSPVAATAHPSLLPSVTTATLRQASRRAWEISRRGWTGDSRVGEGNGQADEHSQRTD